MTFDEGFAPVVGGEPRVLILGTLPSKRSLADNQYYALPQNAFWPIMCRLFGADPGLDYTERKKLLIAHHVALWDVLATSVRPGSLDSSIVESTARANEIGALVSEYKGIRLICFNGRKAEQLFQRFVLQPDGGGFAGLEFLTMPSTSPAHASLSREEKYARWARILDFL
ncbi:MAG: DNA-deoxyinosine glycosylase [Gammaproteobacteria bacterium]|nr:DNA-deoxyinosine glycosylase [Gammaproteobacteria bacterium]